VAKRATRGELLNRFEAFVRYCDMGRERSEIARYRLLEFV